MKITYETPLGSITIDEDEAPTKEKLTAVSIDGKHIDAIFETKFGYQAEEAALECGFYPSSKKPSNSFVGFYTWKI